MKTFIHIASCRWFVCFTLLLPLLIVQFEAQAASYSYFAEIDESGVRNGTNDFLVKISLRGGAAILATNVYANILTSNGMARLSITPPSVVEKVSGYWLWLGVRPSGTTEDYAPLPPRKVKVQKDTLLPATRDPIRLLLIGAMLGFILFETRKKFTIPADVRYSTTRLKFEMAAALYTLIWFVPFFTFLYSPDILYFVLGKERDSFISLPSALVAGLATLYILPRIPGVTELDKSIRVRLNNLAEIPAQLRWLHAALPRAPFKFDSARLPEVLQVTPEQLPTTLRQFELSSTAPLNSEWLRAVGLYAKLSELNAEKRFGPFFQNESQAWQALETAFKHHLECAKKGALDPSWQQFYSDLHLFAARLVLFCGMTEHARLGILRGLGFDIQTTIEGITFNQMTLVFLLSLSIAVTGLLAFTGSPLEPPEARLLKGLMIALIYTCSVGSAVYTSRRTSTTPQRAYLAYLVASIFSMFVAFVLSVAFGVINFDGDIGAALINASLKLSYLISAGITCFATCFMLDTKLRPPRLTAGRLRVIESCAGVLTGFGLAAVIWYLLTLKAHSLSANKSVLVALLSVPPFAALCFIFVCLNTTVAALIPHWFRTAPPSSDKEPYQVGLAKAQIIEQE